MGDSRLQVHQLPKIEDQSDGEEKERDTSGGPERTTPVEDSAGSKPRIKMRSRLWGLVRQYFIEPFTASTNPPWFDARGVAVGLAVGFGVPVGAQVAAMALLRAIFRYNTIVAFAFSWVNNPFTMIPMYYAYYYVGSLVLGRPVAMTGSMFREMMDPIVNAHNFLHSIQEFSYLGWDILVRWSVTAAILASTSAILGHVVGLRLQKARCRRRAHQMGLTYEKLVARLEQSIRKPDDQPS